jgi:hypothetical protein
MPISTLLEFTTNPIPKVNHMQTVVLYTPSSRCIAGVHYPVIRRRDPKGRLLGAIHSDAQYDSPADAIDHARFVAEQTALRLTEVVAIHVA